MKKRMTFAMALTLALVLLAATALGVTTAVRAWLSDAAEFETSGAFRTWGLNEKLLFVNAMRDAGYSVDETLYNVLTDETLDSDAREAAADQIVDARYGDLMRAEAADWVQPPDTVVGMPPDLSIIFREAYYGEYPNASEQEYLDALGRWENELFRRYAAAHPEESEPSAQEKVDEAEAVSRVRSYMTEVCGWSGGAAEGAKISAVFNETYQMWECEGTASAESVEASFDPLTDPAYTTKTDGGCRIRVVIALDGQMSGTQSAAEFAETLKNALVWNYTADECMEIARLGLMERYGLTREKIDWYFILDGDVYRGENGEAIKAYLFKRHDDYITSEWDYAAVVSGGTGKMIDCFTPDDLWTPERLDRLAAAYPAMTPDERVNYLRYYGVTYNPEGGFTGWSVEHKAAFGALFKPLADAELQKDPDYYDQAVEATRRVYGVPGKKDIALPDAETLARRAGEKALGRADGDLDAWTADASFDVSDPDAPVWRFLFHAAASGASPFSCFVSLDARTGAVLAADDPFKIDGWTGISDLL